jgi:hypothetical protein
LKNKIKLILKKIKKNFFKKLHKKIKEILIKNNLPLTLIPALIKRQYHIKAPKIKIWNKALYSYAKILI